METGIALADGNSLNHYLVSSILYASQSQCVCVYIYLAFIHPPNIVEKQTSFSVSLIHTLSHACMHIHIPPPPPHTHTHTQREWNPQIFFWANKPSSIPSSEWHLCQPVMQNCSWWMPYVISFVSSLSLASTSQMNNWWRVASGRQLFLFCLA